jgi:hypothetical protein
LVTKAPPPPLHHLSHYPPRICFQVRFIPLISAPPPQDLLRADHKDLESFLTHIYRAIASAAPLKDKVNVLSYFETLCTDNNAANRYVV